MQIPEWFLKFAVQNADVVIDRARKNIPLVQVNGYFPEYPIEKLLTYPIVRMDNEKEEKITVYYCKGDNEYPDYKEIRLDAGDIHLVDYIL